MSATELLQKIGETVGSTGTVRAVFGEPIQLNGKTVVPVAQVAYAFGGGFGQGKNSAHAEREGEGGGGGGGVRAYPAGALEITDTGTRFVPFTDSRWLVAVFIAGAAFGSLFVMRRRP